MFDAHVPNSGFAGVGEKTFARCRIEESHRGKLVTSIYNRERPWGSHHVRRICCRAHSTSPLYRLSIHIMERSEAPVFTSSRPRANRVSVIRDVRVKEDFLTGPICARDKSALMRIRLWCPNLERAEEGESEILRIYHQEHLNFVFPVELAATSGDVSDNETTRVCPPLVSPEGSALDEEDSPHISTDLSEDSARVRRSAKQRPRPLPCFDACASGRATRTEG